MAQHALAVGLELGQAQAQPVETRAQPAQVGGAADVDRAGEAILAESNAMVAMDTALSLKGKTRGGLMGSIARKFMNDETFFQQRIEADDQAGTVLLAPNLPGDVRILDMSVEDAAKMVISGGIVTPEWGEAPAASDPARDPP